MTNANFHFPIILQTKHEAGFVSVKPILPFGFYVQHVPRIFPQNCRQQKKTMMMMMIMIDNNKLITITSSPFQQERLSKETMDV